MKTINALELAIAAWFVVASTTAWSQTGDAASAPAGAQSASAMTASGTVASKGRKADRALRRRVYAAIGKNKGISAGDISITAKDGAVKLNGTVTEAGQIGEAEVIARSVPGVTSVTNRLSVKKPFGGT
ncbi:putative periplasmic or secreted lipoprotein [Burkholderia sp. Ch1-1]|uniref:Periplasmic or secreted lipoprotein n=1 Tax=Paraburkholderia dioscoreae TaxID=2604047 RepID=A0A5Q4Z351_9BURK|nr:MULTISPECIES: BON domain-containing protein [Paraburkholderia]EIF33479.1 putative periplasmic or secreted lipoprotein [Burkholderia sp. Ch1-1]MDR8395751.1 BON domain-containing protein [Paraburkholderia sp. USG1]VVD32334.1 Putative periplasmic or secreted lipoprotein [Paraburkholderia dioscoreae]